MESKACELEDSDLDWVHVHETLVKKGVACEGFSSMLSQVAVLKSEVLVVDTGATSLLSYYLTSYLLSFFGQFMVVNLDCASFSHN